MRNFALAVLASAVMFASNISGAVSDRIASIRSVSNYLFGEEAHDVNRWKSDLDRMKQCGFNAVWMVNIWADYEPDVDLPEWREDRFKSLREICAAAKDRRMTILLALAYADEGWGPKGLEVPVWPIVERHRQAHLKFLRRMARETRDFDNVIYLLSSEEILCPVFLYNPDKRKELVASFREWARRKNPDVSFWNRRWGTDYTWENLSPADTKHRNQASWIDHNRWFGTILQGILPPMVAAIREENPKAIVGFHDFLLLPKDMELPKEDRPIQSATLFNFYSTSFYSTPAEKMEELRQKVERARELYPAMPLLIGELGMEISKLPLAKNLSEQLAQAEFLLQATQYLESKGAGYSIWSWRTVVPSAKTTFSLILPDGTETCALKVLKTLWGVR